MDSRKESLSLAECATLLCRQHEVGTMIEGETATGSAPVYLVAFGGLVATGKSSLARALAERLAAVRIEADRVCSDLLQDPSRKQIHETQWSTSFAHGFEGEVYSELMRRARQHLVSGEAVVLDGCFARAHQRLAARRLARDCGLGFIFVECRVPLEVARLRLLARDAEAEHPGWQAIYDELAERWEPVSELSPREHMVVRSDGAPETVLEPVLGSLNRQSSARASEDSPRVVTFDCWNTLLREPHWTVAHAQRVDLLQDAAHEAGRAVSRDMARRAFDSAWSRHMALWEKGVATGAHEVAGWGLAALGLDDPHPALEQLVLRLEEASHSGGVVALDGARETLAALDRAGVACGLVCDTGLTPGRVVRRHLDREGLLCFLSVQSFSDETGVPKPDARAFTAAVEPLHASPEDALHVGDLRRTDVAGARALGMTSIRIRETYDDQTSLADADHVVESHAELLELFAKLGIV